MCGSGTLLIEAALIRLHVAPGLYRRDFAFQRWHDFSSATFEALVTAASAAQRDDENIGMSLIGNDISEAAIGLAERDLTRTRISHLVDLHVGDIRDFSNMKHAPTVVVCNPPWGLRLRGEEKSWEYLGQFLRQSAGNSTAVLLSGEAGLTRSLGMRAREKHPVRIGGIDCRVLAYDVFPSFPSELE
jgi:23S rRNA G2445 N2-methylase RlmL